MNWFTDYDEFPHNDLEQLKRQESACHKKLTPVTLDRENQSGTFAGSSKNIYSTTLESCDCFDFILRKAPCKHIYRLAFELGVIDPAPDTTVHYGAIERDALYSEIIYTMFPARLIECRNNKNLTRQEVADSLHILEFTYKKYELGHSKPSLSGIIVLADYFNVSLDYLVGRSDDPTRH